MINKTRKTRERKYRGNLIGNKLENVTLRVEIRSKNWLVCDLIRIAWTSYSTRDRSSNRYSINARHFVQRVRKVRSSLTRNGCVPSRALYSETVL